MRVSVQVLTFVQVVVGLSIPFVDKPLATLKAMAHLFGVSPAGQSLELMTFSKEY